jgi:hypothetical protein
MLNYSPQNTTMKQLENCRSFVSRNEPLHNDKIKGFAGVNIHTAHSIIASIWQINNTKMSLLYWKLQEFV